MVPVRVAVAVACRHLVLLMDQGGTPSRGAPRRVTAGIMDRIKERVPVWV